MNAPDPALVTEHRRLIAAVASQRAKTEALAMFMYEHGNPELSEEDREILGPWEALDDVVQKIWINLADAAYIYIADEIDNAAERNTNRQTLELRDVMAERNVLKAMVARADAQIFLLSLEGHHDAAVRLRSALWDES